MLDAFVKGLLQNLIDVVAYLEIVHPSEEVGNEAGRFKASVKNVNECADMTCLN